eukprot:CAMPEP_0167765892 /NCGR_PEP_ID=MMETSP0110_2-20121227/14982_1 /TAXON_ID=629695 /ORGANISM="Gymnochlora sp., Strain CCMP2014" /LENGTH=578 /DNA_ID=CAMNT_0007653741 /DNA_START=9 /DNA_END=1745 /DNA_ORIENTATION=-
MTSTDALPSQASTRYMRVVDDSKGKQTNHRCIYAILSSIIVALLIVVIALSVSYAKAKGTSDGKSSEISFDRSNVLAILGNGGLASSLTVEDTNLTVQAASTGQVDHLGAPLYAFKGAYYATFSLTNTRTTQIFIVTRQTPLEADPTGAPTDNFVSNSTFFHYSGVISEVGGTFENFILLEPGQTVTNRLNLSPNTVVTKTQGTVNLGFSFSLFVHDPNTSNNAKSFIITTPNVAVSISQSPGIPIDAPLPNSTTLSSDSSSVQYTGSSDRYRNVPYWNYVCADDESAHGFTYSSGSLKGQKVPCSVLSNMGYCSQVASACPVSCNACGNGNDKWNKPYDTKLWTHEGCTSSNRRHKNSNLLSQAESTKKQLCANMLYCMAHPENSACRDVVDEWFGIYGSSLTSSSNKEQLNTLTAGWAKICSSSNYKYQCNPTASCQITFSYNGYKYTDYPQHLVPQDAQEGFVEQCQTRGCGYSATIAWVYSSGGGPIREINLCPIGFWIAKDGQDAAGHGSKANTIIHELSHFVDIAGTIDKQYDDNAQLQAAKTNPWIYLDNADTWGNMADDDSGGSHSWSSF